jgi:excisionase family DNA binding protein
MEAIETLKSEPGADNAKSSGNEPQFLSADELVARLGIGRGRLRRWQQEKIIPSIRPPHGRKYLFILSDVIEALRRYQRGGEA